MKEGHNGFVVSAVLYPLLVIFLALIMGLLSMNDTRKRILERMKLEISDNIFDEASCSCDTILNKLNYIIKNGVGSSSGGSGSMSINVKTYETPSDIPANSNTNDIAIVTNKDIPKYFVSPFQPTTTIEGSLWIKQDENHFALLQDDNLTVPVRIAYQYIDGNWTNVESYVYEKDKGWKKLFYSKYYTEYLLNGADPELYDGLVPIQIGSGGTITMANIYEEWYNYGEQTWANAVLVTNPSKYSPNDTIAESDILMYFVWVPRYRYKLFNVGNSSVAPQKIDIEFENKTTTKSNGSLNGQWLTHPAFTFGDTELNGFWVAKFETTGSLTAVRSKPGVTSIRSVTVSQMFNAARNIELSYASTYNVTPSQIDTHMMKNMEWGAMAYLSHSLYGTCPNGTCTEITYNSNSNYVTGGSTSTTAWAGPSYIVQSTTKNRYGIYDTSGGTWEYVMGNITTSTTTANANYFYSSSSGFSNAPDDKYIDYYLYDASSFTTHGRGKLGDATKETLRTFGSERGGWYGDSSYFPYATYSWFLRSADNAHGATHSGVFAFSIHNGAAYSHISFRVVLSAE